VLAIDQRICRLLPLRGMLSFAFPL
jgi:hypothetical protein